MYARAQLRMSGWRGMAVGRGGILRPYGHAFVSRQPESEVAIMLPVG